MTSSTLEYTREAVQKAVSTGRSRDRNTASLVFLVLLWFSLFFGVMVLLVLIVNTVIDGAPRFDSALITRYDSTLFPERTGFRAGILGTVWLMVTTAVMAVPLGIAAALYLEEFADNTRWYNRLIELNLQNLAAVPSIVYGLLAVAVMALIGFERKGVVLGGAIALASADPAGHHHHHPRGRAGGAQRDPLRVPRAGRDPVADDVAPDAALGHPRHRDRHDPRPVARHRRGRTAAPARDRRGGPVRPDRRGQPGHGPADPDLLDDLPVPGGVPDRPPPRPSSYCS